MKHVGKLGCGVSPLRCKPHRMAVDAAHADFEFDSGTVGVCPYLGEIAGIVGCEVLTG